MGGCPCKRSRILSHGKVIKNSNAVIGMRRIMSHREMELHKTHFIPKRGNHLKNKSGVGTSWDAELILYFITFLEEERRWLRNLQIIHFRIRQNWKLLGLRCCAFSCDYISGAWKRGKTNSEVNKGGASRAKPRCKICVYLPWSSFHQQCLGKVLQTEQYSKPFWHVLHMDVCL